MLPSLAQWLQTLSPEFGFFRVFQYLTFRAVMAALDGRWHHLASALGQITLLLGADCQIRVRPLDLAIQREHWRLICFG